MEVEQQNTSRDVELHQLIETLLVDKDTDTLLIARTLKKISSHIVVPVPMHPAYFDVIEKELLCSQVCSIFKQCLVSNSYDLQNSVTVILGNVAVGIGSSSLINIIHKNGFFELILGLLSRTENLELIDSSLHFIANVAADGAACTEVLLREGGLSIMLDIVWPKIRSAVGRHICHPYKATLGWCIGTLFLHQVPVPLKTTLHCFMLLNELIVTESDCNQLRNSLYSLHWMCANPNNATLAIQTGTIPKVLGVFANQLDPDHSKITENAALSILRNLLDFHAITNDDQTIIWMLEFYTTSLSGSETANKHICEIVRKLFEPNSAETITEDVGKMSVGK